MIPKRIFYCWFGKGEMSELNRRCLLSWKKHCPDYEIIEINENNFDYNAYEYSRIAYEKKNWAFVSDIARIEVLKKHSGFYLDTDVELFKSLDCIRDNNAIIHETGYGFYASGILGCDKFPEVYETAYSRLGAGRAYYVLLNEACYEKYNLTGDSYRKEDEVTFYGIEYFGNPRSAITEKTIGVHWDENSWVDSWSGGFEQYADFVPFAIHNPNFNEEETLKWFGFVPLDMSLWVYRKDTPIDINLMELGNYFYNPKVISVWKSGVEFRRHNGVKPTHTKQLENGCRIEWVEQGDAQ